MSFLRTIARARAAFTNWLTVCFLVGIGGPSALPPRDGWAPLGRRRLRLRTRVGPVLETEAANASPVIEVFAYREYGRVPTAELERVLDIGAHVGAFALWISSFDPRISVVCLEPEGRNFSDLSLNVQRNGEAARISTVNAALASGDGSPIELVVSSHRESSSTFASSGERVEVAGVTLQSLLREQGPFDLVKMDCEGAEWAALEGLDDEAWGLIDRIVLECHAIPGRSIDSMLAQLGEHGLRPTLWSRAPAPVDWCEEVAVIWANR
jgi:FkbM family methyltransferase